MSWSLLAMAVGMLLNFLGSVLLYKGSPLDTTGAGRYTTLEIEWRASHDLRRRKAYSRRGFGFLVCGFLIQGVSLFLPSSAVRLALPNPGFACLLLLSSWGALGTCFLLAALLYRQFYMRPRFRPAFRGGGTVLHLSQPSQRPILNLLVVGPGVEVEWAAVATVEPSVTIEPAQDLALPPFQAWNRIDHPAAVLGWAPPVPHAPVLACRERRHVERGESLAIPFQLRLPASPISVQLVVAVRGRVLPEQSHWLGRLFVPPWHVWERRGIVVESDPQR